jgi:excisionase family DNA binding protein
MTLEQAAATFGVRRDRLKRAAWQGRLRATKIGDGRTSAYLVTEADVRAFLDGDGSRPGPKRKGLG